MSTNFLNIPHFYFDGLARFLLAGKFCLEILTKQGPICFRWMGFEKRPNACAYFFI